MSTAILQSEPGTTLLRFASGNGPVTRRILRTPLRDALPTEIPIIDISPSFGDALADRKSVAQKIRNAATTSGFFYITNHGIDSSITDSAHAACLDYFRQDEEAKMQSWVGKSRYFNGYKPPGSQRINKSESIDVRETFSWTYDPRHDPDVSDVQSIPEEARRFLRIEDFHWDGTANRPLFKESIIRYWQSCLKLARVLVRAFALSMDLPENYFDDKFKYPDAALALNYYPPLSATSNATDVDADAKVSIGSHTDFQLFTILWQDAVGGLQVLNRQGQWIRAAPIPGTFVVNIADYLQRITNDLYFVSSTNFGSVADSNSTDASLSSTRPLVRAFNTSIEWIQDQFSRLRRLRKPRLLWELIALGGSATIGTGVSISLLYVFIFILQPQVFRNIASESFISKYPIDADGHPVDGLARWTEDFSRSVVPITCHSHNDYWRKYPLYSALAAGCTGIEADVWLSDDGSDILVGHDRESLSPDKTLRSMYIDPLLAILNKMNPPETWSNFSRTDCAQGVFRSRPNVTVVLLLDVKDDALKTWPVVMQQLQPLRDQMFLARYESVVVGPNLVLKQHLWPGPITVVGTGDLVEKRWANNWPDEMHYRYYHDAFLDAPLERLPDENYKFGLYGKSIAWDPEDAYYTSVSFQQSIGSVRTGFSNSQLKKLRYQIETAKWSGLKSRYWDLPSWPIGYRDYVWEVLTREGVDMLNIDDLQSASKRSWTTGYIGNLIWMISMSVGLFLLSVVLTYFGYRAIKKQMERMTTQPIMLE
ncbi:Altered inheritance of mitochondria protein 6-like protein 2 [Colletotrichum truncatum]|uniref:Altered inheritance of mitochondria protein 6-like protein 2 n=1 Tax=Colletotrichum truncatum TaxID=5467 RepID=A0ACC3YKK8_COLTU|nr:Altered inheritance of mitochondria protein 6-like protein 2 [Colletotrichum truncatum]KAF6783403.1 Altered inheritance of mitochondria protein 6-like protein 2 [Colletotrichum truncatum]